MRGCDKACSSFSRSCHSWYDGKAVHTIRDADGHLHKVDAGVGVDQGCPLGAFIFAVAMRDPAEAVLAFAKTLDVHAAFYMYLDDCYVVAHPGVIGQILDFAVAEFGGIGLEVNPAKTVAWCSSRDSLPVPLQACYQETLRVLKRSLKVPGDVEHQGLPLSTAQGNLDCEVERFQRLTRRLIDLVASGLDLQTAVSMLRSYAGPASQYSLRSTTVGEAAASFYDTALAKSWSDLLGRHVSSEEPRLWLPTSMGGCGAASARVRMCAAPWAAWLAVRDDIVEHMAARDFEQVLENASHISLQLTELHGRLVQQGTLASIEFAGPVRALSYKTTQKVMVSCVHKLTLRALRSVMDDDAAAFLRSSSGKAVGGFLEPPLDDRWVVKQQVFNGLHEEAGHEVACFPASSCRSTCMCQQDGRW